MSHAMSSILKLPFWHCIVVRRVQFRGRIAAAEGGVKGCRFFTKTAGARAVAVWADAYAGPCAAEALGLPLAFTIVRRNLAVDALQRANACTRFLSVEPLIGPVGKLDLTAIDWVIVGGESGPGARTMEPSWVIDIRNQCVNADVRFFFKQWGGRTPKAGGRLLEGKEWNEFPMTVPWRQEPHELQPTG